MLPLLGFITIVAILALIMSKKASPLVALLAVPVVASLLLGNGVATAGYMEEGIVRIAPVAVMFVFAILYFSLMNEAGLFDPIVDRVVRFSGNDPRKICVGTAILTACAHMDGSGASTFLIVIPAMLPIYDRIGIDRKVLACVVAMAAGVGNLLPWGGPTIRAAAAIDVSVIDLYLALLPVHAAGLLFVLVSAYWLGARESRRLKPMGSDVDSTTGDGQPASVAPARRPGAFRYAANLLLTVAVIALMVSSVLEPMIAFALGLILAMLINFPNVEDQKSLVERHSQPALTMATILFAAGAFTGILSGSGMLDAMASSTATAIPDSLGGHIPAMLAVLSMPLSFLFDPDSFYFGILPVLSGAAGEFGVAPEQVARAALMGQMTTGFPVSPLTPATFLLVGLSRISLSDHQRFSIPFLFATSLVMSVVAMLLGIL